MAGAGLTPGLPSLLAAVRSRGRPWLIPGATGAVDGTATVPGRASVRAADGTHAWGLERQDSDVENVVRFRLVPAS
ncbi:MAG TPA: hypothetical protein VF188_18720 [Longimicrobiales bacterium]